MTSQTDSVLETAARSAFHLYFVVISCFWACSKIADGYTRGRRSVFGTLKLHSCKLYMDAGRWKSAAAFVNKDLVLI